MVDGGRETVRGGRWTVDGGTDGSRWTTVRPVADCLGVPKVGASRRMPFLNGSSGRRGVATAPASHRLAAWSRGVAGPSPRSTGPSHPSGVL